MPRAAQQQPVDACCAQVDPRGREQRKFLGRYCAVAVIEGLLPFVSPGSWRRAFTQLLSLRDGQLRFFGLCSVVLGLILLWFVGN